MVWCPRWYGEGFATPYRVPEGEQVWIWGPSVPLALAVYAVERGCFVTEDGDDVPQKDVTHFSDFPPDVKPGKVPSLAT